jgi:hypothetical protein
MDREQKTIFDPHRDQPTTKPAKDDQEEERAKDAEE